MTDRHDQLRGAGRNTHHRIDLYLPTSGEKSLLSVMATSAPVDVTGARDDPEAALANLLAALESLGLITDSTAAT
jgi:hypothetical protein